MTRSIHRIRPPESAVYTSLGSSVGLLVAMTAVSAIINTEVRSIVVVGFGVSCGIMSLTMINRMLAYDRHVKLASEVIILDDPEKPTVERATQYANQRETGNGREYTYSGIYLNDADMAKLASYVLNNKPAAHRDGWNDLGLSWRIGNNSMTPKRHIPNTSMTVYQYALTRWGRGGLGWFEGSELTEAGREFFGGFVTPPTPQDTAQS